MNGWLKELSNAAGDVTKDAFVASFWLLAIYGVNRLNHHLQPPAGLIMYAETRHPIPLEWLFQFGEIGNIALFVLRGLYKVATRSWK